MSKLNCIVNPDRLIRHEQERVLRMAGNSAETVLVSDHVLYAGDKQGCYFDQKTGSGCFWTGILDNRKELEEIVRQQGLEVAQHPAQLLYQLYQALRENAFQYIEGPFAILFVEQHNLVAIRDPMGVKTLYMLRKLDGEWLFSNQISTLFQEGSQDPILNRQSFLELFALGPSISEGKTLYKNVTELKMGTYLYVQDRKESVHEYFTLPIARHTESFEETVAHIRSMVSDSVRKQMSASSVGASFLSGGLDSSILCALGSQICPGLKTYSLDYEENQQYFKGYQYQTTRDEEFVSAMVQRYNFDHCPLTIPQQACADLLEESMRLREGPGMADIDSSLLWMYQQVRKKHTSILTGECADELFGGYPWFYRSDLVDCKTFPWLQSLPQRIKLLKGPVAQLNYQEYVQSAYWNTISQAPQDPFDSQQDNRAKLMTYCTVHWFMQTLIKRQECLSRELDLTVRAPFCDPKLYAYLYNVPWSMKFYNGQEKGLLRMAFADVLPEKVAFRKKNPYPKTYHPRYTQLVETMLKNAVDQPDAILPTLLQKEELDRLIESGGGSFQNPWFGQLMMGPQLLAYLLQLEMWLKNQRIRIEL